MWRTRSRGEGGNGGSTVVVAHNGPLTLGQQEWACILGAGRPAAICGRTAARDRRAIDSAFPTVALYLNEALVADQVRRAVND